MIFFSGWLLLPSSHKWGGGFFISDRLKMALS